MSPAAVRIVLVRPRNPLNIGAAARAMANFGFDDLVVVNPYEKMWRETVSAVGAEELVRRARRVKSFAEAVKGCDLVLGTTAVKERRLDRPIARLPELGRLLEARRSAPPARIAVVFGSEKTGLDNKILDQCGACLTIPTHESTPSMNLGQAVAVCCYQISLDLPVARRLGRSSKGIALATVDEKDRLARHAAEVFAASGYLSLLSSAQRLQRIRRSFTQWNLRASDVRILHGIFRHILRKTK